MFADDIEICNESREEVNLERWKYVLEWKSTVVCEWEEGCWNNQTTGGSDKKGAGVQVIGTV